MQLSFGFGPGEGPAAPDGPVSKLSAALAAARRTALYGPLIARAAAGRSERNAPDAVLARLPTVSVHAYIENREQFRNPRAATAGGRKDRHAAPEEIRGSLEELLPLAARIRSGEAETPAGARRLVVRTGLGDRLLSDRVRDSLWRVFELPIFEELRGSEGELLAAECEGHAGLHLETGAAIFEVAYGELVITSIEAVRYPIIRLRTGWVGAVGRSACPCGETAMRFVPVAVAETPARKPPAAARTSRTTAAVVGIVAAR